MEAIDALRCPFRLRRAIGERAGPGEPVTVTVTATVWLA